LLLSAAPRLTLVPTHSLIQWVMEVFSLGLKLILCLIAMKSNLHIGEISYKDINWIELAENHV
jgi:hypothetical protein